MRMTEESVKKDWDAGSTLDTDLVFSLDSDSDGYSNDETVELL